MKRAMAQAAAWCVLVAIFAFVAGHFADRDVVSDGAIKAISFPLFLITRAVSGTVDLLGPAGRAEPASHYLSQGWVITLAILSFVLYWAVIALAIFLTRSLWNRLREKRMLVPR